MICDIVQLPRRLHQFRREASITSEQVVSFPMSSIARDWGYWEPNDEDFIGMGGKHRLIIGKDALFRYKFIEPTKIGIAEYFVMTKSPIDIRYPLRNKKQRLYCPWVTITNAQTLRVRKFIIWNGIFELMHYETEDSIHDAPIEAVLINELRNQAMLHDRPDIIKGFENYPKDWKNVLISEERLSDDKAIDALTMLGSNIKAYNELTVDQEPYYWPDLWDIFRGVNIPEVWTDMTPLNYCTFLSHVIYGHTTMESIRHLFGMTYDTHAFQREFNTRDLHPCTEISIYDDSNPDLFGILKYIERIGYSEFEIAVDANGKCKPTLYNPYDTFMRINQNSDQIHWDPELLHKIGTSLKRYCPTMSSAEIISSWASEVYITIKETNGNVQRYFFDLVSASLGSRSLIRDYDGHIF